ncbi:hypothetical protein Cgig2_001090 [Carnegiea gigantea]|uniref:Uncharacterized protein n=1 Tax=Carnegiea gigantea TaxID=171969 RepID=A0A9Q1JVD3_9CARY|nr:hypothetical protein Cgig2_001090 [Carnegiea gigantea]
MASPRKRKKPPDFLTNSQLGFHKFQSCPLFHLPGLQTINLNLKCAQPSSEFAFRPFYICFILESYNHSHTSASLLWLYRVDEMPMAPCNWFTIMLNFRALSCLGSSSPISPRSIIPLTAMGWKQLKKQKSVLPAFSRFEVLTFKSDKSYALESYWNSCLGSESAAGSYVKPVRLWDSMCFFPSRPCTATSSSSGLETTLIDANVQGRVFTWKKILRGQLVYEKLDRVLLMENCAQLFPSYTVNNGPFTCFDHAFVLLNTEPAHLPRRGTNFKYQYSWVHYQETHSIVKHNWRTRVQDTSMYQLVQKLEKTKLDLKSWSKHTFGNFKHKLERNTE